MLVTAALIIKLEHPFSRSYGVNLPSSLTRVISNTLVSSTHLPVSVCGTVRHAITFRRFSRQAISQLRFTRRIHLSSLSHYVHGFAYGPRKNLHAHYQQLRSGGSLRLSITNMTGHGISTVCPSATPFGLALGPTNLQRTNLPEETLDFRWTGFSPVLSLLMLAFSLACSPPRLTLRLRPSQATLLYHSETR